MSKGMAQKRGRRDEKKVAKKYGGIATPSSGSKWFAKGDVLVNCRTSPMLIENKLTTKKSFTLKLSDLLKVQEQALEEDRLPVFRISFDSEAYIVLPEWVYLQVISQNLGEEHDKS